jgi:hypothetical protein
MHKKIVSFFIALFGLSVIPFGLMPHCNRLPPEGISPLFAFGYSIVNKRSFALSEIINYIAFDQHSLFFSFSNAYYGLSDHATFVATLPVVSQEPITKNGNKTGLGDLYLQVNYELFQNHYQEQYKYRIIGSTGMQLPTSTVTRKTLVSFNTPSFFLGLTQDALTQNWYFYCNSGILIPTKKNEVKFGNVLLNNMGCAKIKCWKDIDFGFFAELSSFHFRPTRRNNILDATSGGTVIFFGPTIRANYKNFLAQTGFQYAVVDRERAVQPNKIKYILGFLVAYQF